MLEELQEFRVEVVTKICHAKVMFLGSFSFF